MKKFRLLAVDMDGTLLNDEHEIPETNRQALRKAVEEGVRLAIASGRMTPRIDPLVEQLGLDPIVIAYNGAKVLAPRHEGRQTLFHKPVPVDVAKRLIEFSREEKLLLNFYHEDRLFAEDGPKVFLPTLGGIVATEKNLAAAQPNECAIRPVRFLRPCVPGYPLHGVGSFPCPHWGHFLRSCTTAEAGRPKL